MKKLSGIVAVMVMSMALTGCGTIKAATDTTGHVVDAGQGAVNHGFEAVKSAISVAPAVINDLYSVYTTVSSVFK